MARKSTRKITRKSKPDIRWDAETSGVHPEVEFNEFTKSEIVRLCGTQKAVEQLQNYLGRFLLMQEFVDKEPTAGDYKETLKDLERVASDFIDRLEKLHGHPLESVLYGAWYDYAKELPDWSGLEAAAWEFRKNVLLAKRKLPDFFGVTGRRRTTGPIQDFMYSCARVLEAGGQSVKNLDLIYLAELCLESAGELRYARSLHHYVPKKVAT